jgi:hypothetical protein
MTRLTPGVPHRFVAAATEQLGPPEPGCRPTANGADGGVGTAERSLPRTPHGSTVCFAIGADHVVRWKVRVPLGWCSLW